MNPRHYHTPIDPESTRVRCPVCQEAVYSLAGIHPQCAIRLSDPPRPKTKPPMPPGRGGQAVSDPQRAGAGVVATPSDSKDQSAPA